jgi:hypothetical protein
MYLNFIHLPKKAQKMPNLNFSMPSTHEHVAYHNRFGGVRKFLGRISFMFLIVWAAADFFGMSELILPQFPLVSFGITALLLIASHTILYHTTRAAGYDIFDGSGKLESGGFILLPIFISGLMLWFSYLGAEKIIQLHIVHKPVIKADAPTLIAQNNELLTIADRYSRDSAAIAAPFAEQIEAVKGRYVAKIAVASREKTYDADDVKRKNNGIAALKTKRDGEIADIRSNCAAELSSLNAEKRQSDNRILSNFGTQLTQIQQHNGSELGKKASDEARANGWAWLFSGGMCLLFWLTTLWGCRIDCKSGIIPTYNHTEGDQHDVLDVLQFVVQDIFRSRSNNLIVGIHEKYKADYKVLNTTSSNRVVSSHTTSPTAVNNLILKLTGEHIEGRVMRRFQCIIFDEGGNFIATGQFEYIGEWYGKFAKKEQEHLISYYRNKEHKEYNIDTLAPQIRKAISDTDFEKYLENIVGSKVSIVLPSLLLHAPILPTIVEIKKFNKTIQGIQTALAVRNPKHIDITAFKDALYDLNPRIVFYDTGLVQIHDEDYAEVEALAIQYMRAGDVATPTPSVGTPFNDLNDEEKRIAVNQGLENIERNVLNNQTNYQELFKLYSERNLRFSTKNGRFIMENELATPTLSVANQPAVMENTVTQPISTVTQFVEEKAHTDLDDKLENLRKKILENSESHFSRGDAKNQSIAKRIFDRCDDAFLALKKGGDVTPSVVTRFKIAALDRLSLCQKYNLKYDSYNELMGLIESKEVQQ